MDLLLKSFITREDDLKTLDDSHNEILHRSLDFNKSVTKSLSKTSDNIASDEDSDVVIWGDVTLTDAERDLLNLGPGFMVVAPLDRQEMMVEENVSLTKIRWGKMKLGTSDLTGRQEDRELEDADDEEVSLTEAIEAECRDVLSSDASCLDMRRKRATDMRGNRRVFMPGPGPALVEAEFATRSDVWDKTFARYRTANYNEAGEQRVTNLSRNQVLGLKTLSKKVAKLEVIILEADKGKTFVVTDEKTYIEMARDHIDGDEIVDTDVVKESQRVLLTTAKALANIMCSRRNYERCFDNSGSAALDVPNMKLLPKVHKPPGPRGHLQSRPVVTAASGLSSRAGDQLSDFLEPLVAAQVPRFEDLSTEEVLSQLQEVQEELRTNKIKDSMVCSLDVRALYPSLDQAGSSRVIANFVKNAPTKIAGIDWKQAQVFVASNMDKHKLKREGVAGLVPKRLKKRGARPGNTTKELWTKRQDQHNLDNSGPAGVWQQLPPQQHPVEAATAPPTPNHNKPSGIPVSGVWQQLPPQQHPVEAATAPPTTSTTTPVASQSQGCGNSCLHNNILWRQPPPPQHQQLQQPTTNTPTTTSVASQSQGCGNSCLHNNILWRQPPPPNNNYNKPQHHQCCPSHREVATAASTTTSSGGSHRPPYNKTQHQQQCQTWGVATAASTTPSCGGSHRPPNIKTQRQWHLKGEATAASTTPSCGGSHRPPNIQAKCDGCTTTEQVGTHRP